MYQHILKPKSDCLSKSKMIINLLSSRNGMKKETSMEAKQGIKDNIISCQIVFKVQFVNELKANFYA